MFHKLRVLITPKTRDVSSDKKLRMPSLLVQPFPAQMQIFSTVRLIVAH